MTLKISTMPSYLSEYCDLKKHSFHSNGSLQLLKNNRLISYIIKLCKFESIISKNFLMIIQIFEWLFHYLIPFEYDTIILV